MFGFGHFGGGGASFGFFGISPFLIFFIVMMIVSALRRGRWGGGYRGGRNYPRQGPPYDVRPYQRGQYDPNNPNNPNNQGYPTEPGNQGHEYGAPGADNTQDNTQQGYNNEPTYGYPVTPPAQSTYSGNTYGNAYGTTAQGQAQPNAGAGAGTTRVDNLPTGGEPTRPVPYDDLPDEVKARIPRPTDAPGES